MTQTSGMPAIVAYALGYAKRGWRVFPLHSVRDGLCTCGHADCSSVGKHPRTRNGVKDATTDREQISRWWQQWPEANIGIATGQGLYVIDVDQHKGSTFFDLGLPDGELARASFDAIPEKAGLLCHLPFYAALSHFLCLYRVNGDARAKQKPMSSAHGNGIFLLNLWSPQGA